MYKLKHKVSKLISKNRYINQYKANKNKNFHSFSYLIRNKTLSQSDYIKAGIAMEKVLRDIILDFNKDLVCIKPKNIKNFKEKDHLFLNEKTKEIFYSELKSNLNLDTEKSKSTYRKCLNIVEELKKEYPDYNLKWCLLGLRYHAKDDNLTKIILNKYPPIKDYVYGVNNYFNMLDVQIYYTQEEYTDFVNEVINTMTNCI